MSSTIAPTGGFKILGDASAVPPFGVVHYLKEYDRFLDSRRFAAMCLDRDKMIVFCVHNVKQRHSAVGAWVRH